MQAGVVLVSLLLGRPAAAEVNINGLTEAQALNVRAFLRLDELACDEANWLVSWEFREADTQIRESLEALGYYNPTFTTALNFHEECWRADVEIDPGEPVMVREVRIDVEEPLADTEAMQAAVASTLALQDRPLNHEDYESAKRTLIEVASTLGFFDSEMVDARVEVHAAEQWADIVLTLSSGPRYQFGKVDFGEEPTLRTKLLEAMVPFEEGDPFDNDLLIRFRRNLAGTNFFSTTLVIVEQNEADGLKVPIRVELAPPQRRWTYQVGAGYATDTKVRLRADAFNTLRNRRGHRVEGKIRASQVISSIDLSYHVPHRNPLDDWFIFDVGAAHEETSTSTSDIYRLGVRHTYNRGPFIQTDFLNYQLEDWEIGSQEDDRTELVLLGSHFLRVWRETALIPRHGYRIGVTLRGAHEELASDTSFFQVRARGRYIHGLTAKTRAIWRAEVGFTIKDDFDELPPSVRFFAGGDNSIRGYGFRKVGPEENGEVVGGSNILTGSLEVDYLFRDRWAVATFIDTGSAYDDEPSWFTGVGVGVRWHSPFGAIRVDLAHPLDDDTRSWRVHISLGPDL
jgi:translocation and assembly module TamA